MNAFIEKHYSATRVGNVQNFTVPPHNRAPASSTSPPNPAVHSARHEMSDASDKPQQANEGQSGVQEVLAHGRQKLSEEAVAATIREASELQPVTSVDVKDISGGCGTSFAISIVSQAFHKMPVISRHRLVHSALRGSMDHIHAIQLKCYTPEAFLKLSRPPSAP